MFNWEDCFFGVFMWMNNEDRTFIPLWFLRNYLVYDTFYLSVYLFPYHYGSHATNNVLFVIKPTVSFPYHYGSHATEVLAEVLTDEENLFPYHYGSHATFICRMWDLPVFEFPYHYGSHATNCRRYHLVCCAFQFPYHYGSHATQ